MVKNIIKVILIILTISIAYPTIATSANATGSKNSQTITVEKKKPVTRQHKREIIPTIILGIFTFILAFLVFFVRSKVAKEIKRRQNR